MGLKMYYDLMSQPSRALYILLKSIPYQFDQKPVDLRKGAHFSDEFMAVNRFQKVPVIDHNGFVLTESVAIVRYLACVGVVPEGLYPSELQKRARVDEFLEWQHIGLRLHTAMYFRVKYMDPVLAKVKPDMKKVAVFEKRMESALADMETKWLGRGQPFVAGDQITVADLLAACEIEQPRRVGYDVSENFPNIAAWLSDVRAHFEPHYSEAHATLDKIAVKYASTVATTAAKL